MCKSILVYSLAPFVLMLGLTLQKDLVELQNLPKKPPFEDKWVDSVFQTLSPREKIAQLFMVAAFSNWDEQEYAAMDCL
ncbi:MAG TPA: hypothetical protein DCM08_14515, partial [Microscillaceae bacterium]|nr:hypothetical protein [Microscillaceae bacterium]